MNIERKIAELNLFGKLLKSNIISFFVTFFLLIFIFILVVENGFLGLGWWILFTGLLAWVPIALLLSGIRFVHTVGKDMANILSATDTLILEALYDIERLNNQSKTKEVTLSSIRQTVEGVLLEEVLPAVSGAIKAKISVLGIASAPALERLSQRIVTHLVEAILKEASKYAPQAEEAAHTALRTGTTHIHNFSEKYRLILENGIKNAQTHLHESITYSTRAMRNILYYLLGSLLLVWLTAAWLMY